MTPVERITALDSLIYAYCRRQFQANGVPPDEARIIMECVLSKFRWNCIDASTLKKMLSAPPAESDRQYPDAPNASPAKTRNQAADLDNNIHSKETGTEVKVNADNSD